MCAFSATKSTKSLFSSVPHPSPNFIFPVRIRVACLLLLALAAPRAADAQSRDALFAIPLADARLTPSSAAPALSPRLQGLTEPGADDGRHSVWLVLGGTAGGGLGMVAGMVAGAVMDGPADEDCIDFCFGPGLLTGALVGEAVGMALGVHLAYGRRGSFSRGALTSSGILAAGLFVFQDSPEVMLMVPIGQLIGTLYSERATARRRR
jgi:hypothetical protein